MVVLGGGVWLIADARQPCRRCCVRDRSRALAFGVTMVLPIGGADMPVVISLLNAFTGTAVAMAGFVLDNSALIIAGALVGASGGILTKLMADAMNRSIAQHHRRRLRHRRRAPWRWRARRRQRPVGQRRRRGDPARLRVSKVIIVPGYGLAAAQAQHEVAELADLLETRGVEVATRSTRSPAGCPAT